MCRNNQAMPASVLPPPLAPPYRISNSVLFRASVCGPLWGCHITVCFIIYFWKYHHTKWSTILACQFCFLFIFPTKPILHVENPRCWISLSCGYHLNTQVFPKYSRMFLSPFYGV